MTAEAMLMRMYLGQRRTDAQLIRGAEYPGGQPARGRQPPSTPRATAITGTTPRRPCTRCRARTGRPGPARLYPLLRTGQVQDGAAGRQLASARAGPRLLGRRRRPRLRHRHEPPDAGSLLPPPAAVPGTEQVGHEMIQQPRRGSLGEPRGASPGEPGTRDDPTAPKPTSRRQPRIGGTTDDHHTDSYPDYPAYSNRVTYRGQLAGYFGGCHCGVVHPRPPLHCGLLQTRYISGRRNLL